jgi:hypothetical protein
MENPECTSNALSDLLKSMRTTSYARYDAHKRCERLNNSSLFALTSASMLLIFMGIIDNFSPEIYPFLNKSHLELFSILTSITILVLSLVVSFASYSLKSERYFRSGNEIGELCDRLRFLKEADVKAITDIAEQYYLLRKNSDNHQGYNYKKGRLERKRQSNDSLDSSDNLTIIELIGYWSPIMAFYSVSLLSFIVFAYEILKFAHYA